MATSRGGHASNERTNRAAAAHPPASHVTASHESTEGADVELGPVDWPAWIAGALGVLAGLAVIAAFFLAGRG